MCGFQLAKWGPGFQSTTDINFRKNTKFSFLKILRMPEGFPGPFLIIMPRGTMLARGD